MEWSLDTQSVPDRNALSIRLQNMAERLFPYWLCRPTGATHIDIMDRSEKVIRRRPSCAKNAMEEGMDTGL